MKKYQIIYADPPWKYNTSQHDGAGGTSTGGAHTHYLVMEDEEIARLPVGNFADNDCLLFMWATGPKLDSALKIGENWGFQYITMAFVWDKQYPNPGAYTMSQCEYCLLFKKGNIPKPRGKRNARQFLSDRRSRHSRKPPEVRLRISSMFPSQDKIELFARKEDMLFDAEGFEGWDVWGDEVESDIEL